MQKAERPRARPHHQTEMPLWAAGPCEGRGLPRRSFDLFKRRVLLLGCFTRASRTGSEDCAGAVLRDAFRFRDFALHGRKSRVLIRSNASTAGLARLALGNGDDLLARTLLTGRLDFVRRRQFLDVRAYVRSAGHIRTPSPCGT